MAKIIVVANKKGGVGKSACALNLCAGLALKGYKVLGIDLDSQANFTKDSGTAPGTCMGTFEFLYDGVLEDVVEKNRFYDYICADKRLETQKSKFETKGSDFLLRIAIREKADMYDYVVLDTPPSMDGLTFLAFVAADYVLVAADCDVRSLDGFADLVSTVNTVKRSYNPFLVIKGVLITMFSCRTSADRIGFEHFVRAAGIIGTKVFNSKIRRSTLFHQCTLMHKNVFDFDSNSDGAKDYMAFVEEFLEDVKNG